MTRKSRKAQWLIGTIVMVVVVFASAPRSEAQTITGSILGTIRDQQGAVIPNTSVSAKNVGTGAERTAISDASGGYSIVSVPAGSYEVTASAAGFQTEVHSGITMTVGAAVRVDFSLNVGAVAEKVEVTAEAPQVDTTTSTMSGLVGDTVIRELPLNGRDWLQLALLQPGALPVVDQPAPSVSRGTGTQMSISGGRPTQNVFRVDGLVVNDELNRSPGSALGVNMGVDAIREFSVLTDTFPAEYGRSSGGVINAITKSGTNTLHGTAFYFHRNSALDARNFFDATLPPFRRHQFGASVGGPIKRDKLFFFANYEGLRQFLSLSIAANTLSPNARNGILASGATVTVSPRVQPYFAFYPLPNGPITGDTGRLILGAGQLGTEDYVTGKIDYQLSANTAIAGSYTFDKAVITTPNVFDNKLTDTRTRNQRVMLSMQHVFSPVWLNTVRTGFNRFVGLGNLDHNPATPAMTDLSLGFLPGKPAGSFIVPGLDNFSGLGSDGGNYYWYTAPQLNDDLAWVKGRNNIRIGFSVEGIRDNVFLPSNPSGIWTFGSIQDFLTAVPQQFRTDLPGADPYRGARTKIFGAYIQDDFRIRSNLTLNLGMRYEPGTVVTEINGRAARLANLADSQPTLGNPVYQNPTLRNFAPRIGFAWDPFGTGKTAIRSGFAIFDIDPLPNLFNNQFTRSIPFFAGGNLINPPSSSFPNGALSLFSPNALQSIFVENKPHPAYKVQWNLNIQRQIAGGLNLTAGYAGSRGVHLPVASDDTNMVPATLVTVSPDGHLLFPATRPIRVINPNFSQIRSALWYAFSSYHSLQVNVAEQFRHGFTLQGVYVWSKTMDNGSLESGASQTLNTMDVPWSFNTNLNRSVSDFDTPHHLSINFLWDAPASHSKLAVVRFLLSGWEPGGIFTAQSGAPFNVRIPTDRAGTGSTVAGTSGDGQRPDFKPGPGCSTPDAVNSGNPNAYVRLQCFSFPALGTLGNLGRNVLRGPNLQDFDFSLFKNNNLLAERLKVQFRAEFFNLFNRANFATALLTPFNSQGLSVPANAALRSTATRSRQIQFGMKFIW